MYDTLCGKTDPAKIVPFMVEIVNSTGVSSLVVIQRIGG